MWAVFAGVCLFIVLCAVGAYCSTSLERLPQDWEDRRAFEVMPGVWVPQPWWVDETLEEIERLPEVAA